MLNTSIYDLIEKYIFLKIGVLILLLLVLLAISAVPVF